MMMNIWKVWRFLTSLDGVTGTGFSFPGYKICVSNSVYSKCSFTSLESVITKTNDFMANFRNAITIMMHVKQD